MQDCPRLKDSKPEVTWPQRNVPCSSERHVCWLWLYDAKLIRCFRSLQLWPHISSLHIITHLTGYFCARSEATIWLRRRQPVLDRPGHKALKANWLIALAVHFQCHLFGLTQVKHKWWPDPVCTNICRTWSRLISQTKTARVQVPTHRCLMSATSLLSPLQTRRWSTQE